jgi:putative thioredoxin
MTSEFIIDVTEADFEYNVISYSQKIPVVVDFWAEWCVPCKSLGPLLERLTERAKGQFRLAKVNVDQNPNLAFRFNIRSIPAVKAFRDGQVISEFMGNQPEGKIREFLREVAPDQGDLNLEKGNSLLDLNQAEEAETCFRKSLEINSTNTAARLGLIRSLLFQGKGHQAVEYLNDFPASSEYSSAQRLIPLANAYISVETEALSPREDDPTDATFNNSIRLAYNKNFEAAMDGILEVLRIDKTFRDDEARLIIVAILEMLGDNNPITRQYRNELATVLF